MHNSKPIPDHFNYDVLDMPVVKHTKNNPPKSGWAASKGKQIATKQTKLMAVMNPDDSVVNKPLAHPVVKADEIVLDFADYEDPLSVIMNDPERSLKRNDRTRKTVFSGDDGDSHRFSD